MKVLIVDDTTFMRTTIRRILEQQNIQDIYEAENGLEALTKYKILRPDLVIMDISMPVMDGIESVRLIKAFDLKANVIICSLQGQKANVMEAIKAGARSFLVKPVKADKLLAEIAKLSLSKARAAEKPVKSDGVAPVDQAVAAVDEAIAVADEDIASQLAELQGMTDSEEDFCKSEDYMKGVEAGYLEARREIATNMVRLGLAMDVITSCVELTEEEVEDLKIEYRLGF